MIKASKAPIMMLLTDPVEQKRKQRASMRIWRATRMGSYLTTNQ